jgi:hypothetical protein
LKSVFGTGGTPWNTQHFTAPPVARAGKIVPAAARAIG